MITIEAIGETDAVRRMTSCSPIECRDCGGEFGSPPPRRCPKCGGTLRENPALRVVAGGVEQAGAWARVAAEMDTLVEDLAAYIRNRKIREGLIAASREEIRRAGRARGPRGSFGYTVTTPEDRRVEFGNSRDLVQWIEPYFRRAGSTASRSSIGLLILRAIRQGRRLHGFAFHSDEAIASAGVKHRRAVTCRDTGETFASIREAAAWLSGRLAEDGETMTEAGAHMAIRRACDSGRMIAGYGWKYAAEILA